MEVPSVKVFPNPSSDGQFYLLEHVNWEVYSIGGTKVTEGRGRKINLSPFNKGMCILRVDHEFVKLINK